MRNIVLACDYGGLEAKDAIISHLKTRGYQDILEETGIKQAICAKITEHLKTSSTPGYDYFLEHVYAENQDSILQSMIDFSGVEINPKDLQGSSILYDLGTHLPGTVDRMDAVDAARFACAFVRDEMMILNCMTGEMMMNTAKAILPGRILTLADMPDKAKLGREHNDSSILVIPGSIKLIPDEDVDRKVTTEIVDSFLDTQFNQGKSSNDPVRVRRKKKWDDLINNTS